MLWNDPNNPADYNNPRQGFADYLQGQGWDGQGRMSQYAQQLRGQGQHPWLQYMQQQHPGMQHPGLGGLAGMRPQMPMGQFGGGQPMSAYQNAPRPMQPAMPSFGGSVQGPQMGLSALADPMRRKPVLQPR